MMEVKSDHPHTPESDIPDGLSAAFPVSTKKKKKKRSDQIPQDREA